MSVKRIKRAEAVPRGRARGNMKKPIWEQVHLMYDGNAIRHYAITIPSNREDRFVPPIGFAQQSRPAQRFSQRLGRCPTKSGRIASRFFALLICVYAVVIVAPSEGAASRLVLGAKPGPVAAIKDVRVIDAAVNTEAVGAVEGDPSDPAEARAFRWLGFAGWGLILATVLLHALGLICISVDRCGGFAWWPTVRFMIAGSAYWLSWFTVNGAIHFGGFTGSFW